MSRGVYHILPMMSANFVTVFSFISLSLSILCIRRVTRQRKCWDNLTVLEDCTLIMWRRRILELAFDISLTRN